MKEVLKRGMLKLAVVMAVLMLASSSSLAGTDTMTLSWDTYPAPNLNFTSGWWVSGSDKCTGPTKPSYDGGTLTIGMDCDRSGSSDPAWYFNQNLYLGGPNGNYNHGGAIAYYQTFYTGADNPSFDMNPGSLNWVIEGSLQVGTDKYNIVVGEGHSAAYDRNNWWIGGPDLTGYCGNGVLATMDGKYLIRLGSDDHSFIISAYPYPAPNWMKPIPDVTPLSAISMPGTHDSGTYAFPPQAMLTSVVTQYQSIRSQLSLGVRVFDVRLTDSLQICHGNIASSMDLYLKDVLDQAFEFLKSYPSETIVMVFKQDKGSSISSNLLHSVMYGNPLAQYWTDNRMPTLGDVRGKIVVVSRDGCMTDEYSNPMGMNINSWPDNTTGLTSTGGPTPVYFGIQDHYDHPLANPKADDVKNMLNDYINNSYYDSYWFFNYLSCTPDGGQTITLTEIASEVTSAVLYLFPSAPDTNVYSFATTMLDFAGVPWTLNTSKMGGDYWIHSSEIADRVIKKNFENATASATVSFSSSGVGVVGGSGNNLLSSSLSEASSLDEAASQLKDRYMLRVDLAYDQNEFNLFEHLSDKSGIYLKIGSYEFSRRLGDGVIFQFFDGVSDVVGDIIHEPGKEIAFIVCDRSKISILIVSEQTGDGRNILDMTGKSGPVSGELEFSHRLHNTSSSSKVPYNGTVEVVQDKTGATIHTWKVNSVNGN
jgi:1-phosphatidylinositol phosphodiesterase